MVETTPVPWVIVESEAHEFFEDEWYVDNVDEDIGGIAVVNGEANARLFAVSRETLEALAAMTARYLDLAGSGDCGFWNPEEELEVIQARAAIAKAKGE